MNTLVSLSAKLTLGFVFLVILVGGVVKTTGAGMGCPDWPTCFGQVIPPTDISQLPADYKTRYQVQGKKIADFDAFKTWTEYINRLCGLILGISSIVLVILMFWKQHNKVNQILSLGLFVGILFEGWLGAVVVASDLEPVKITTHMLMAMFIIILNVILILRLHPMIHQPIKKTALATVKTALFIVLLSMILQTVWGTGVREQIDVIAKSFPLQRELWINQTTWIFFAHRSFSLFIAGVCVYLWFLIPSATRDMFLKQVSWILVFCVLSEILVGVLFVYADFPAFAQPIHLILSSGIIACITALLYGVFQIQTMLNIEK